MRLAGLSRRSSALVVAGAVGVAAAAFCFFVEGRLPSASTQTPRVLQATQGGARTQPEVCKAKKDVEEDARSGGETEGELPLTATKGVPLKFQCDTDLSLKPQDVEFVFKATDSKTCNSTAAGIKLADELTGASLSKHENAPGGGTKGSQVYVFNYSKEPEEEKHLCYTCVSTTTTDSQTGDPGSQKVQPDSAATEAVKCTVYITVPKKQQEPTTSSSTAAPDSPSGAQSIRAALGTAVGVSLALMLQM